MSQATSVLDPLRSTPAALRRIPTRWVVAGAVLLVAFLPLLIEHGKNLWLLPHYQFYPLALVGSALLAWRALQPGVRTRPGTAALYASYALAAVSWLMLATGGLIDSPRFASFAVVLLLAAAPLGVGGWPLLRSLLPALSYLLLIIPPPGRLDVQLVGLLQKFTARASSHILDFLGVYHSMAGNVVETAGHRYMVEEACSGIHSLFSIIACTLFYIFWARIRWVRAICLLLAGIFWVLVQNTTRVVLIAWLDVRWGDALARWGIAVTKERADATSAWDLHFALDFVLFGLTLLLLASTDRFLRFLGESFSWRDEFRAADARPSIRPAAPLPEDTAPPHWLSAGLLGGAFAIVAVPQIADLILTVAAPLTGYAKSELIQGYNKLEVDALPAEIAGWKQSKTRQGDNDFVFAKRDSGNILGEFSRTWRYEKDGQPALVSFDYPFPEWHDLRHCYGGNGWQWEGDGRFYQKSLPGHEAPFDCCQMIYSQPVERHGYLWFVEFDQAGEPVRPLVTWEDVRWKLRLQKLGQSWQRVLGMGGSSAPRHSAVLQIQVFLERYDELPQAKQDDVEKFFLQAAERIRGQCLNLAGGH